MGATYLIVALSGSSKPGARYLYATSRTVAPSLFHGDLAQIQIAGGQGDLTLDLFHALHLEDNGVKIME
jgi:hypothetical protein